ncbi:MAG: hypothetical protein IKN74_07320 [Clostridia bacterium]|nr:hypothetical protein [Clostridia bacterium]
MNMKIILKGMDAFAEPSGKPLGKVIAFESGKAFIQSDKGDVLPAFLGVNDGIKTYELCYKTPCSAHCPLRTSPRCRLNNPEKQAFYMVPQAISV